MSADSKVGDSEAKNLREEASQDAGCVGVDIVAAHLPRTDDWAAATGPRIAALRAALERIGRGGLPIYLNEERRAEPRSVLAADAYRASRPRSGRRGGLAARTAAG
jgi:hypothetical protein